MDYSVEIRSISKQINKKMIIDDISLNIRKGEVFGLLGPNGAGKTTLIRTIVGLISTTKGDVVINGKSIKNNFEEAIEGVGALVESPALYTNLSGYRNLKIFSNMYKNISDKDIEEVIKLVNLENGINERVKNYSLGMKQRLGIAIALLHNPSVLILDEPTNGLDPEGIHDLRNYLRELASKRQTTVIVSSHLLSEMELMCDRFAIINRGKIINVTSKDLYSNTGLTQQYLMEVDNSLKAFNILKENYKAQLIENNIKLNIARDSMPEVVLALTKNEIKLYSIIPETNSLEQYYFDVINGKDKK